MLSGCAAICALAISIAATFAGSFNKSLVLCKASGETKAREAIGQSKRAEKCVDETSRERLVLTASIPHAITRVPRTFGLFLSELHLGRRLEGVRGGGHRTRRRRE